MRSFLLTHLPLGLFAAAKMDASQPTSIQSMFNAPDLTWNSLYEWTGTFRPIEAKWFEPSEDAVIPLQTTSTALQMAELPTEGISISVSYQVLSNDALCQPMVQDANGQERVGVSPGGYRDARSEQKFYLWNHWENITALVEDTPVSEMITLPSKMEHGQCRYSLGDIRWTFKTENPEAHDVLSKKVHSWEVPPLHADHDAFPLSDISLEWNESAKWKGGYLTEEVQWIEPSEQITLPLWTPPTAFQIAEKASEIQFVNLRYRIRSTSTECEPVVQFRDSPTAEYRNFHDFSMCQTDPESQDILCHPMMAWSPADEFPTDPNDSVIAFPSNIDGTQCGYSLELVYWSIKPNDMQSFYDLDGTSFPPDLSF